MILILLGEYEVTAFALSTGGELKKCKSFLTKVMVYDIKFWEGDSDTG